MLVGCKDSSELPSDSSAASRNEDSWSQALFDQAVENLNRLEESSTGSLVQTDVLPGIVDRLNRWVKLQPAVEWSADPIWGSLPQELRELHEVRTIDKLELRPNEGLILRQAVWFRDASNWARGSELGDLVWARNIFDWTVRNVQLEPGPHEQSGMLLQRIRQMPWQTLLLGRGTVLERAWVFVLLLRQQGIEAALLAVPNPKDPEKRLAIWTVAVLIDKQLYLFDPALGLPIPAPGGLKLDEAGRLEVKPATLDQLVADDSLLRRMAADKSHPYPIASSQLKDLVAMIVASPSELSVRMKLIESQLSGDRRMVLTVPASPQAKRFTASEHVSNVRLWPLPYGTVVQQAEDPNLWNQQQLPMTLSLPFKVGTDREEPVIEPALWKGRVLYLKGRLVGAEGTAHYFQLVRTPDSDLAAIRLPPEQNSDPQALAKKERAIRAMLVLAKQNASYWLGLVVYEQGNYQAAIDYFDVRTLQASPDGPWTDGAKYNLARAYEALGEAEKAIALYRSRTQTLNVHGNLLRARWLESLQPGARQPKPQDTKLKPPSAKPKPKGTKRQPPSAKPKTTNTKAKPQGAGKNPKQTAPKPQQPKKKPADTPPKPA